MWTDSPGMMEKFIELKPYQVCMYMCLWCVCVGVCVGVDGCVGVCTFIHTMHV